MEKSQVCIYNDVKEFFVSDKCSLDIKIDNTIDCLSELVSYKKCEVFEVYPFLLLCYLKKNMIVEAGFLVGKYNIPIDFEPIYYDVPDELKKWFKGQAKSYEDYMLNCILGNDVSYIRLMEIVNDKSYELAKILICIARYKKRKGDITRLSHCINDLQNRKIETAVRTQWELNGWGFDSSFYKEDNYLEINDMIVAASKLTDFIITCDDSQIKKSINEAYRLYSTRKTVLENLEYGTLNYFWTAIINGLVYLKEYQTAVKIYREQAHNISDAEFFLLGAKALLALENSEDGLIACRTSCSMCQNSENLLLLGKVFFHERMYKEAQKVYKDACNLLNEKKKVTVYYRSVDKYTQYVFETDYTESESLNIKIHIYSQLLLCYIKLNDYSSAKELVDIAKSELIDISVVDQMQSILDMSSAATIEIEQLRRDKSSIKKSFEDEKEKNDKYKDIVCKIENMLNKIRTSDLSEIDDDMWDEMFSDKMNEIISSISNQISSSRAGEYNNIYEEIKKRFPKMSKDTICALASAEQMYRVFYDNVYIDKSPIIVEYSRAVEMLLWDYVEGSGNYLDEIEEACSYRNQGKTFGAINSVINCQKCPLKRIYNKLNDLRMTRNNSAHVLDKKSQMTISQVHDFIWEEDGLLEKVNSLLT